jgi:HlyD family secretion protein
MKRKLIIVPLAIVLAVAGVIGFRWWSDRTENGDQGPLRLFGHMEHREALLAFREQERLAEVLVEEGARVTEGQILARLHTRRLEAQIREAEAQVAARQHLLDRLLAGTRKQEIEQARAEYNAAQVRVANARRTYERIRQTAEVGASTEQALDNARSQLDLDTAQLRIREKSLQLAEEGPRSEDIAEARSRVEAGRAALELLQIRLADMVLTAPAAGVVRSRILEPGEMADPGRPVLALSLTDPKWVRAYIPGPQLGHIRPGMAASVVSDSFPDRPFEGWIGFISPEAEFTPKNVQTTDLRTQLVYEVRIHVQDPEDRLRLGMPVTVEIERRD